MSQPFIMFHKDYARAGRQFDADDPTHPSREQLAREGWVNSYKEMGKLEWEFSSYLKVTGLINQTIS